jgi:hypothetical protein
MTCIRRATEQKASSRSEETAPVERKGSSHHRRRTEYVVVIDLEVISSNSLEGSRVKTSRWLDKAGTAQFLVMV